MTASTAELTIGSRLPLNRGGGIPALGLGVFQSPPGKETRQAVEWALEIGYRHIDTAAMYGNEADVGAAVRASGIPREEIFVTTKLWFTEHGFERAQKAARKSLDELGLSYMDLYLIHWPRADTPDDRLASWRAFEKLQRDGVSRAIGVSNYTVRHLEELRAHSEIVPAVDQVEFHPFIFDPELLSYCDRYQIRLEAWSPLTRGRRLDDPTLTAIASAHGKSPAQVLVRWGLQHGIVEIPKSIRRERIAENAQVFDFQLTPAEMARLDALRDGRRVGLWNPADIP
ncbi:MAG TPA: aldo/keto reductase [Thermoplasmata archaeon]|nr:aldo/keto reductase [Thermoplasmata archaeon]